MNGMSLEEDLSHFVEKAVPLSKKERLAAERRWHEIYSWHDMFLRADRWTPRAAWGKKSGRAKWLRGARADEAFGNVKADWYYIIPTSTESTAYKCTGSSFLRPEMVRGFLYTTKHSLLELIICPTDFSWTVVFIAEDECESFFASRPDPGERLGSPTRT